jgi:hypothetical protein
MPPEQRGVPVPEQPPLTEHDKAMAQAIAEALKPLLIEIDRKLDKLAQRLDAIAAAHQCPACRRQPRESRPGV